jgi:hypothetical protein
LASNAQVWTTSSGAAVRRDQEHERPSWDTKLAAIAGSEKRLLWIGALAAVAERAAWALLRTGSASQGEAHNIAVALASGRGFADAFRVGQGPTDHLVPTTPAFAGAIYALLGINTPVAEFVLWAVATALAVGSYLIYYRAFGRLGAPKWARLAAFWFLCLAPTYVQQESSDYRVWDGALAAFLCALFLDRLLAMREERRIGTASIVAMALLAAATFFTKPPVGLGIYPAAGLFCVLNLRGRQLATALIAAPIALALFVVPWGLRNEAAMGKFIPMRDNAGLELALSQYPGALAPIDGKVRRLARYQQVHPFGPAYRKFAAVGEVAYYSELGRETKQWMRDHPAEVSQIMVMHMGQIVTPPAWLFRLWGNGTLSSLRAFLASLVGVLGLLGLAAGLATRRPGWVYLALIIVPSMFAYLLFQPLPRYLYLFYAPFAFSATGLIIAAQRVTWPILRPARASPLP